jgi:ActD protein
MKPTGIYGLMAEFDTADELVAAGRKAYSEGYRKLDAYSPFPIEALDEAIGIPHTILPWLVFFGGLLGGAAGYGLEYWTQAIHLPLIIGGKPLHSWPNFIPVWFETTVLGASLTAVIGMLGLNGLPLPYHPVFNIDQFLNHAQKDKFFLVIESNDPKFKLDTSKKFLSSLSPANVWEVPN